MGKRGKQEKKDPFELAPQEFKDSVNAASDGEINAKIAEVAMNDAALADAKKEDQDLTEKKGAVKEASRQYVEGRNANRAKIAYARDVLKARGKPSGDAGVDEG